MQDFQRYLKKSTAAVVAVQLDLDFEGFAYEKWGGTQRCKKGDWVLCNEGDTYTVDGAVFERTYHRVGKGLYVKTAAVWARVADESGTIRTIEGSTDYAAGDYIVYNDEDRTEGYAVSRARFEEMYAPAPDED
ncbi:MAG: hypothetical protein OES32_08410 [Acidobacteriota bacterium]|nr:hypothetical protein [Acidobacteriota bacterium]MDH3523596.1 hypothetical protein [Acidobacteriota bacterium]